MDNKKLQEKLIKNYGFKPETAELSEALRELKDLNKAISKKYEVFAECVKEPRGNLDSGAHHYQIRYLSIKDKKPERNIFWVPKLMNKNNLRYLRGYTFKSSAIGMSRLLAATNHVFTLLRECGGGYLQIS